MGKCPRGLEALQESAGQKNEPLSSGLGQKKKCKSSSPSPVSQHHLATHLIHRDACTCSEPVTTTFRRIQSWENIQNNAQESSTGQCISQRLHIYVDIQTLCCKTRLQNCFSLDVALILTFLTLCRSMSLNAPLLCMSRLCSKGICDSEQSPLGLCPCYCPVVRRGGEKQTRPSRA